MIAYLLIGLLLALALLMVLGWWSRTDTDTAKRSLFWLALAIAGLLGLGLLATGRGIASILPIGYTVWRLYAGHKATSGGRQSGTNNGRSAAQTNLSREEALEILGLADPVTEDDVQSKYRKLMAKAHPDAGGSKWMASQLNAARDRLLQDL